MKNKGIIRKYKVERLDGKYSEREYFVLDPTCPYARIAARVYADACEKEYPQLALELRNMFSEN